MGLDPGAVNKMLELEEADIAYDIGVEVVGCLDEVGVHEVTLMQNDNLCGENGYNYMYSVCGTANRWGADIVVSIHCNAAANKEAKGTECLVYSLGGPSEELAECIQRQIVNTFDTVDRGIKDRPDLAILRCTTGTAVLVETAFISNYDDALLLRDNIAGFGQAIAKGITDYIARIEGDDCQND